MTSIAVDVIDSISASNMAVSMSNLNNKDGNFKALIYYLGTGERPLPLRLLGNGAALTRLITW